MHNWSLKVLILKKICLATFNVSFRELVNGCKQISNFNVFYTEPEINEHVLSNISQTTHAPTLAAFQDSTL